MHLVPSVISTLHNNWLTSAKFGNFTTVVLSVPWSSCSERNCNISWDSVNFKAHVESSLDILNWIYISI